METISAGGFRQCLAEMKAAVPCRYLQWLAEDPGTHDYTVKASVLPEGEAGYDVAHRTGIIGQVFRTEQPILARNVKVHPLYDSFDGAIDWELCFPLFNGNALAGVINLEGSGTLERERTVWRIVGDVIRNSLPYQLPDGPLRPDTACLLETQRLSISQPDIVQTAKAIARGGEQTLLVGNFPDLLRDRSPTMAEARRKGLGVSYCVFGVESRLDLLATGSPDYSSFSEQGSAEWWPTCAGRYAFVLEQFVGPRGRGKE
jgi:hypothetical protein